MGELSLIARVFAEAAERKLIVVEVRGSSQRKIAAS
jgi:hypothetical protein